MANNKRIKIAGYAKRIFFNDNIEYRNFSPDLVGFQLTSEGGTTLFTNGNFSISVNLDPKPNVLFTQGTKSKFFTLDDIVTENTPQLEIQKNLKTKLNLDLTNPISYVWYGSSKELIRASLIEIQNNYPAAIYVDNKVGSVTGNNITDYVYDLSADESTFKVNSNFFVNPYNIKYTVDAQFTPTEQTENPLRNFTLKNTSYVIEHNGIRKNIKSITPATQKTNSEIELIVEGNPFPELTGLILPQISFLSTPIDSSIPYFIKPNESEIEKFFSSLNELQLNLLDRNIYPKYTSQFYSTKFTDNGVVLTSKKLFDFPILEDGYNLNFFDSYYIAFLDKMNQLGEDLDNSRTDIIIRKYTTEAINSFDTVPRADGDDYVLNGEKATKLLRIYGVEFDYIKKYINGIKLAHVVTYDKKNNVPDALVKDLAYMLGLDPVTFITDNTFSKLYLPSNGGGEFSGTSTNMTQSEIDIELYRRLILNIAWLWKSKGTRKAVEFLFRFIGAPESLVNFNEYIVIVDKPLDVEEIKKLLYIYTGEVNFNNIPYDDNGFPLPPINGDLVITNYIDQTTGQLVENDYTEMYFQKAGGWYRETYGSNVITNLDGNNPHVGAYDGGSEYLQYFSRCFIPNFNSEPTVTVTAKTLGDNYFLNYNHGLFNSVPSATTEFFTTQLTFNPAINTYQFIEDCVDVNYSIIETPLQNDGKTTFQQQFEAAEEAYLDYQQQILQNSYLAYSPEWYVIQNNYTVAQNNALLEVSSENCDINQTLQICVNELPQDNFKIDCSSLSAVTCDPYIYFVNSGGTKVSFNEFASCCTSEGGQYVTYTNEECRVVEYCSKSAPCVGEPVDTLPNGIIVFEMTNNTMPSNVYTLNGKCYQLTKAGQVYFIGVTNLSNNTITGGQGGSVQSYLNNITTNILPKDFYKYFQEVDCDFTTVISSPECCAWYGYNYQLIEENNISYIVCTSGSSLTTPSSITNDIDEYINDLGTQLDGTSGTNGNVVSTTPDKGEPVPFTNPSVPSLPSTPVIGLAGTTVPNTNPIGMVGSGKETVETPLVGATFKKINFQIEQNAIQEQIQIYHELVPPNLSSTFVIPPSLYDTTIGYVELQNPIGEVPQYYSTTIYDDCLEEAIIVKGVGQDCIDCYETILNSLFEDPNFMDPTNWVVHTIDEYGRVSFTPTEYYNDFVLDWNATGQLAQLYQSVGALFTQYTYGSFYIDTITNNLIPYVDNGNLYTENPNSITNAVVDPNHIGCGSLDNVSIVFASEAWSGFKLPEVTDCSCKVDFSFDYMIKYQTENLKECVTRIDCYPAIIHDNTLNSLYCMNFVSFTNSEEDSSLLENNFNDNEDVTEEYVIWQNTQQNEPILQCCNAVGGNITELKESYSVNFNWVRNITNTYGEIITTPNSQLLNTFDFDYSELITYGTNLNSIKKELERSIGDCYFLNIVEPGCFIDFNKYITTTNICMLEIPLEYGLWTNLYMDYKNTIEGINGVISQYESNCVVEETPENLPTKAVLTNEIINSEKQKNTVISEKNTQVDLLVTENTKLKTNLTAIDVQINQKNSQIDVINKALSDVTLPLDCIVYENEIYAIDSFNVEGYCTTQIYGDKKEITLRDRDLFNNCVKTENERLSAQKKIYLELLSNCNKNNTLEQELVNAKFQNNQELINQLIKEIGIVQDNINTLSKNYLIIGNEVTQTSQMDQNDYKNTINETAKILGVTPKEITNVEGYIDLTDSEKITLTIELQKNQTQVSSLIQQKDELIYDITINETNVNKTTFTTEQVVDVITQDLAEVPSPCDPTIPNPCCTQELLNYLNNTLELLETNLLEITDITESLYDDWYSEILTQYNNYINNTESYLTLIDNLKLNFKLFVDNNNLVYTNQVDSNLTYLPYTQSVNPFWEFDPSVGYSGIILDGSEQDIALIQDSVFTELSNSNTPYNSNLFEPNWGTFNFTIPECVCDDLRRLYPNKEFFFSVEIENYNCSVCLLIDNIIINVSDCKTERLVSLNNCLIPQLSCVIDNKKSWVYTDQGIITETVYPDGPCNTASTNNYQVVKMGTPEERLWTDLEYRYTNYDVNHSDLIINVKNTTFSIDPSKAIECDVFNYWKNIDCDGGCPTSCTSASTVVYSGMVYSSTTLLDYTLDLSASTTGLTFSCSTFTDILENQVTELKNQYYTLTSDYNNSLNATYYDLLNLGYGLSNFEIQNNNCGTDTLVINNNQQTNNLFGLITENYDGTISVYESYIYSGSTPYIGGTLVQVLSGVTAQTFNQTTFVNEECCKTINNLLNGEGTEGLGLGKNYQWDSSLSKCLWKPIDGCSVCEGDCEYCGTLNECSNGYYTGSSYNICINPLDYLDIQPSEINVKDVFDQLVQSNLIDVKSRQTISDYPLLRLFYELYLNANNCGKELSGKFTYNTMFEFMDKIGDYWLNLLEQVVPATTIWEGCDNSGKIYRNTIFDQNKFQYKRYSLNLIETTNSCPLSAYTDFSIGSEYVYSLVEQIPLFPTNDTINNIKNQIRIKNIQIELVKDNIAAQNKILCSLNLQDFDTPNLQSQIDSVSAQITLLTNNLNNLETQLSTLYTDLSAEETKYLLQQQNYYSNFMSCSGLTETLLQAENNLNNFIYGTTLYERQRNYIAILRDKIYKCVRASNTLISDYNTVFITQIYDTNEYEGNVTIIGDPDWEDGGDFYNQELIHNCTTE